MTDTAAPAIKTAEKPLFEGAEWNFDTIQRVHDTVEKIAVGEMGLDVYPNQIEVITAEQMLDAYASSALPLLYKHWSFGKSFAQQEMLYRKGFRGLAYEIVINSSPCISYIMEENTALMQTLVIAHAAFGHNHFFKNNYVFQQWTDAEGILDYLDFAQGYIAECEQKYGHGEVERLLDAAHALQQQGVFRYPRKKVPDLKSEERKFRERQLHEERVYDDLWRTLPKASTPGAPRDSREEERRKALLQLPQENILYFLEKTSPMLKGWQREVLRIVRNIAQYFYPQRQTKMMNEGCATWTHYTIMGTLHDRGLIPDGAYLEFLQSHTNVVFQPEFDDPRYSGLNPYAVGFAVMRDIERACLTPDEEDHRWFPDIAGCGDPIGVLKDTWHNFRDESFIQQYLGPKVIRDFRLFDLSDDSDEPTYLVRAIHNERGYREIRNRLAWHYDIARMEPDIQVVDVDLTGDRRLMLRHRAIDGVMLEEGDARRVLGYLADLWGYDVLLTEVDAATDMILKEHKAGPRRRFG
ncbi:SpoVR-like protein [Caenispirillum salinarum AK4]|uniref:SpoVR-like protein n=1 Tax=Caenispirillum salinarum AK4 TaxID=1238182 RepID=K9GX41_9PROT|nr:SpoVR family protein [Caenispirillum salinarum]EKV29812.1 SpoVR-like protein [Caenispirillum salinarum AK4]